MFKRTILKSLEDWRTKPDRKPLILRGARQVGKTTTVRIFAKSFKQFIDLNLEKTEDRLIFERENTFSQKIESLFYLNNKVNEVGPTLIFIDEIQNSPEAVQCLRYFHEERPDLFVIAAGSLLENLIDRNISFPVGRVEFLAIHPCSFKEYLAAIEEDRSLELIEQLDIPEYAHEKILALFNRYTLIGGMPEVIDHYSHYKDLSKLPAVYDGLLASYMDDVEKYAQFPAIGKVLRHLINTAFLFTCNRITFEGFGNSKYKSREVGEAFRILEKAMLLRLIYPVESAMLPMLPNLRKSPKLFLLDTGLVIYYSKVGKEVFEATNISDAFRGKIAEQIIGQELLSQETSVLSTLHFWTREEKNSQAEVDYIYLYEGNLIPVEVKSGGSGRLRSIHQFVENSPLKIAVRFWSRPLKIESSVTLNKTPFTLINIPFYHACNLANILQSVIKSRM